MAVVSGDGDERDLINEAKPHVAYAVERLQGVKAPPAFGEIEPKFGNLKYDMKEYHLLTLECAGIFSPFSCDGRIGNSLQIASRVPTTASAHSGAHGSQPRYRVRHAGSTAIRRECYFPVGQLQSADCRGKAFLKRNAHWGAPRGASHSICWFAAASARRHVVW